MCFTSTLWSYSNPQACCYGCNGTSNLLKRATHSISSSNIDDVEFRIGFADSSILVYPGTVNDDCDILDARLMWVNGWMDEWMDGWVDGWMDG